MRCRDHIALTLPSFLLRLTLAITFLWAGTAKIVGTTTTQADNAARLANLGVTFLSATPDLSEPTTPDEPLNTLPDTEIQTPETDTPELDTPAEQPIIDPPVDPSAGPNTDNNLNNPVASRNFSIRNIAQTTSPAVGSDYPDPVEYRRVYGIALLLDHAANPTLSDDSQPITPIMPAWLGTGRMPVYAAWATAATEIFAAVLLLIGLLTRFSALSLMIVMLVAIWTTNIGPATLQSTDAILGFIPNAADPWSPGAYQSLLWQLALIVMSCSVMLLGAGPLSLDRLFFRPSRRDPYVSGETASQKPKPQRPPPPEPQKDRSEFDRSPPPQSNPTP